MLSLDSFFIYYNTILLGVSLAQHFYLPPMLVIHDVKIVNNNSYLFIQAGLHKTLLVYNTSKIHNSGFFFIYFSMYFFLVIIFFLLLLLLLYRCINTSPWRINHKWLWLKMETKKKDIIYLHCHPYVNNNRKRMLV